MGRETLDTITSIVTAIIGLAILSVIVSKQANTTGVIQAASSGLASDIQAATSPITGAGGGLGSLGNLGIGSYQDTGQFVA
jgi:hypothetical protein